MYRFNENQSSVAVALKNIIELRAEFPDYVAGLDIAGHEDNGPPMMYFIDQLLHLTQTGVDVPYFFHAAETSRPKLFSHHTWFVSVKYYLPKNLIIL